jgi:hypothetical protein
MMSISEPTVEEIIDFQFDAIPEWLRITTCKTHLLPGVKGRPWHRENDSYRNPYLAEFRKEHGITDEDLKRKHGLSQELIDEAMALYPGMTLNLRYFNSVAVLYSVFGDLLSLGLLPIAGKNDVVIFEYFKKLAAQVGVQKAAEMMREKP